MGDKVWERGGKTDISTEILAILRDLISLAVVVESMRWGDRSQ